MKHLEFLLYWWHSIVELRHPMGEQPEVWCQWIRMWETNGNDVIWTLFSCGRWQQLHTTSVGVCFRCSLIAWSITRILSSSSEKLFYVLTTILKIIIIIIVFSDLWTVSLQVSDTMDSARGRQSAFFSLSPHSWTHEKEIVEVSLCTNSTSVLVFYLSCRKLSQPDDQKKVKWEEYFVTNSLVF